MNTPRLLAAAALAFAASGAALAQEATYELPQVLASGTTRAAVQAEAQAVRADSRWSVGEGRIGATPLFAAQRSRSDVNAEAVRSVRTGYARALAAEPGGFAPALASPAARTVTVAANGR